KGLTLTADYYDIKITDLIGTLGTGDILDFDAIALNELSANPSAYKPGQVVIGDRRVERGPIDQELIDMATALGFAPAGPILLVNNPFVNQAGRHISGWDFGFEYAMPKNSLGSFRISGNASYLETFDDQELVGGPVVHQIQNEINPRLRANATVSWRNGPWSAGVTLNYLSETIDNDVVSTEDEDWIIEDYLRTSIRMGYRFNDGMLDGLALTLGVRNLFDTDPSFNPDEAFGYEPSLHSNRGRMYYVDLEYSF
ncbi:MAG TPA: TonB-dependent receptor, partial [Oceanipulchritudo sp.]|nr:TonB-dependent receptor [Oceanipulchritudo sp.]